MKGQQDEQGEEQGGEQGEEQGEEQEQKQGQQQTTLRITTTDDKVIEIQIDGEIKSIQSQAGGGAQQQGQQQ